MSDEGLGELLRREGLHQATLNEWERDALEGLSASKSGAQAKRIAELERQLLRKDRALAETVALLVLQKKVQALWAVADHDIDEPNESKSCSSSTKR